jgi:hypothetical protein
MAAAAATIRMMLDATHPATVPAPSASPSDEAPQQAH